MSVVLQTTAKTLMAIGPVVGYVDQLREMKVAKSSEGFSINTSAILLISNILRIFFWLGKRFDTVLLVQSIIMVAVQLVVVNTCVRYRRFDRRSSVLVDTPDSKSALGNFWKWRTFLPYVAFLLGFAAVFAALHAVAGENENYVEAIGTLALAVEAAVPLPQALQNRKLQSVEGFSLIILLTWVGGDSFKTTYFLLTEAPIQFALCGITQLAIDCVIMWQSVAYSPDIRQWLGLSARGPSLMTRKRFPGAQVE